MPRVLAFASEATLGEIEGSAVWRQDFERQAVSTAAQAISAAVSFRPQLILIDRELPSAELLLKQLRSKDETRSSSVVVLSRGEQIIEELGLLGAGANAVLRLPPGPEWDDRIAPLLSVPARKETRIAVALKSALAMKREEARGKIVNLSTTGMLVDCSSALPIGAEVGFRLELPGFETSSGEIKGSARVIRLASAGCYGMKFLGFEEGDPELIRRYVLVG
jgi:CheY-like chemotaxis protein